MALLLFGLFFLLVLVVAGQVAFNSWKSSVDLLNAQWLDETEKLKLVSRWGLMG